MHDTRPVTYNTTLVPRNAAYTRTKACRVVKVANGTVLSRHDSRVACARALGIHPSYVSLVIHGWPCPKIIDKKHGELTIMDGKYAPKKPRSKRGTTARQDAA